jgi:hypothetical protein
MKLDKLDRLNRGVTVVEVGWQNGVCELIVCFSKKNEEKIRGSIKASFPLSAKFLCKLL